MEESQSEGENGVEGREGEEVRGGKGDLGEAELQAASQLHTY